MDCLDAETLAAWEDDGLDASTVAAIEQHVSTCARCQAMVAVSLRGAEAVGAVAAAPAKGTDSSTHRGAIAFWRWLVPLTAAAAAVTVWMVVPDQQEIATAPPERPPVTESAKPQATPPEAPPSEAQAAAPPRREVRQRADAAAEKKLEARQEQPKSVAESAALRDAPAPPAAPAVATLERSSRFTFGPLEIISPAPAQRWRVTPAGIERSIDAGGSWSLVRASTGETITGGTSPSPTVCWLIGDNGVALLTTDGTVFTRIDIPNSGNLRSITAVDARSATVINAAGRTFRTEDGGGTWR